jgi:hypothetical protein
MERSMIEEPTPKAIFDLYALLPNEGKSIFLRLLSQNTTGEQALIFFEQLPVIERMKVDNSWNSNTIKSLFPKMLAVAYELFQHNPQVQKKEFMELVINSLAATQLTIERHVEAQLKQARDPKPRNVERDAEIIRLAKEDKNSGEIHRAIKSRWPCTVGAVNQVIMRAKRDGQLPK